MLSVIQRQSVQLSDELDGNRRDLIKQKTEVGRLTREVARLHATLTCFKGFRIWWNAVECKRKECLERRHKDELDHVGELLAMARRREQDLLSSLEQERTRRSELETNLQESTTRIGELERTLKDVYKHQFEEMAQKSNLEQQYSTLVRDYRALKSERDLYEGQAVASRTGLGNAAEANAALKHQLSLASLDISQAGEMIEHMHASKLKGMGRFFEKYDLPAVVLALFRKVAELQGYIHGCHSDSTWDSHRSSSNLRDLDSSSATRPLEALRQYLKVHGGSSVPRSILQSYIEQLCLTKVSSAMASQVILALLGLDTVSEPCSPSRFVTLLACPPAWQQLEVSSFSCGLDGEPRPTSPAGSLLPPPSPRSPRIVRLRRASWAPATPLATGQTVGRTCSTASLPPTLRPAMAQSATALVPTACSPPSGQ
eukprot:TRINITY_DN47542_c0_g1_i1.p1 TRINITY_DN47542_c0_g1~~TRINITY_DN47542_c0_g1_i1.p1  ORF type:complete len:428 (-),score=36.01 TRINITY_DN47542_c0_g1_i1:153-1436(-)